MGGVELACSVLAALGEVGEICRREGEDTSRFVHQLLGCYPVTAAGNLFDHLAGACGVDDHRNRSTRHGLDRRHAEVLLGLGVF
ncbi:hypothetical protein SDC9_89873 [bioreactor metagenome]|uniref:Uncharacterized protein n=1 Tax=bioreactor metagenome TaxID=1076179 RepID=A0A644ZQF0_9ZZZZ